MLCHIAAHIADARRGRREAMDVNRDIIGEDLPGPMPNGLQCIWGELHIPFAKLQPERHYFGQMIGLQKQLLIFRDSLRHRARLHRLGRNQGQICCRGERKYDGLLP